MIRLHHLRIGRSIFTVWQLEELGVPYELIEYIRDPKTFLAPPELKKVHASGKSPVIDDDGVVVAESIAITTYLLQMYDPQNRFAPARSNLKEWARFTQWLHYPEGSVFTPLLVKMLLIRSGQEHAAFDAFSSREIKLHMDYIAAQLGTKPYILGDSFSAADFGVSYVVSLAKRLGQLGNWPTLDTYLTRNQSRPAYMRALERAIE
ncbi:MAG: glutathione S-transferase family protein [Gammaproteobacteria bacterium]|nr:glutathione S-transferase family protein [Gammaproteobacteria bacterium]